ncbi:MAG: ATP-binding cassette domain-containing protein, partial [Ruminococcus sp.]|nr:ATP-binding cassette domain-containing protein [Ruminococcus sp.]
FYDINEGSITIDGISINNISKEELRMQFAMVLQDTWLFQGTIRENLILTEKNITDERLDEVCRSVGIYHFIKTLPKKYDTEINESVNLSSGQRQQLAIARAMIANRKMLILDEATSSVDTRLEQQIQSSMDILMEGRTTFVIAHRLSTIINADLILVMSEGDIVESGNHNDLMQKNGVYAELYNSQFKSSLV